MIPSTDGDELEEHSQDATSLFRADALELDASADETSAETDDLLLYSAMLVVKRGPNAGSRFLLDQAVTSTGRHPNSDIFLDDVTVSRRHVEFRRENETVRIVDTNSLNGTRVNRMPVQSAVLTNGDEIQIGRFRLVFLTSLEPG